MTGVKKLYWKTWLKAAAIRAVKTFAQTAAAMLGAGAVNVTIDAEDTWSDDVVQIL